MQRPRTAADRCGVARLEGSDADGRADLLHGGGVRAGPSARASAATKPVTPSTNRLAGRAVSSLRRKLADVGEDPSRLQTVRGFGYRYER